MLVWTSFKFLSNSNLPTTHFYWPRGHEEFMKTSLFIKVAFLYQTQNKINIHPQCKSREYVWLGWCEYYSENSTITVKPFKFSISIFSYSPITNFLKTVIRFQTYWKTIPSLCSPVLQREFSIISSLIVNMYFRG